MNAITEAASVPAIGFKPHTQLGRSGYVPSTQDRLIDAAANLDALLTFVTFELDDDGHFQRMNQTIQHQVLHLAADLAREVNELVQRNSMEEAARLSRKGAVS